MGVITRRLGCVPEERSGGLPTEVPVLNTYPTLPSGAIFPGLSTPILTPVWGVHYSRRHHLAKLKPYRKVCWLHITGTFDVVFFWRSTRWTFRQSLSCVALKQGPVLPYSSRLGQHHPQRETVLICPPKNQLPKPAELSSVGEGGAAQS